MPWLPVRFPALPTGHSHQHHPKTRSTLVLPRTTVPAQTSLRLRMSVSMISHRVFFGAFAYERVRVVDT